jgi:hypothetical protein
MDRREKPTHVLKLEMLLFVLQSRRQTCRLWAPIPTRIMTATMSKLGKGNIQTPGLAELLVREGQLQSCLIRDQRSSQTLFAGQMALELLQLCGVLSWYVQPELEAVLPLSPSPTVVNKPDDGPGEEAYPPPRQAVHLTQQQIASLPRKHRQVFQLVNGRKGIEELCFLLHCTREQLLDILTDLAAKQLISWSDTSETERK